MKYLIIRSEDYLEHHGILGMKWGVWNDETARRYKNADGTLTEEGKKYQKQLQNELESGKVDPNQLAKELTESGKDNWNTQLANAQKDIANSEYAKRLRIAQAQNASLDADAMALNSVMGYGAVPLGRGAVELQRRNQEFQEYVNRYLTENEDLFASAALKDLGYEDTEAGREFLKKHGILNWSV